eukprot:NODE_19774_length_828_cov_2.808845.p5 GENE.NODE_19774_length_828_cov_2.808845~~NODE_19774_length_828_cov_2.808845.p5  ORF type:complete len:67 (-),score=2.53 NODE_19774_length_828_cov_2.808845:563-763(-)
MQGEVSRLGGVRAAVAILVAEVASPTLLHPVKLGFFRSLGWPPALLWGASAAALSLACCWRLRPMR